MPNCNMATLPLILALCAVSASALDNPVNVDCGTTGKKVGFLNMTWVGDDDYVRSGLNGEVSDRLGGDLIEPLTTVRYFPHIKKNCYSFPEVEQGEMILVRASFYYGNYDNQSRLPEFDVLYNGNFWGTVSFIRQSLSTVFEVVHLTKVDGLTVCLVRTNDDDVPFINSLEIKLLDNSVYTGTDLNFPLYLQCRYAYALPDKWTRNDTYDRIWIGYQHYAQSVSTSTPGMPDVIIDDQLAPDKPPAVVLKQAITVSSNEESTLPIPATFTDSVEPTPHYVNLYFTEVLPNANRSFDIYLDGEHFVQETVSITYGFAKEISNYKVNLSATSNITLMRAYGSTLPPLINAAEFFRIVNNWSDRATLPSDVKALNELQKRYEQLYEWSGDPCLPSEYGWEWVGCNNEPSPQVTALNLSGRGLTGSLFDFSNLTFIETIDLHNNSLNGSIPEFLGNFPKLKQLNLADNEFTGSLPKSLIDRKIILNISGNNVSVNSTLGHNVSGSSQKKTNTGVVAGATISVLLFLCLLVMLAVFIFTRRPSAKRSSTLLESEIKHDFSHAEIVEITNNFEKLLGEGGSGKVYYGQLRDGLKLLSRC